MHYKQRVWWKSRGRNKTSTTSVQATNKVLLILWVSQWNNLPSTLRKVGPLKRDSNSNDIFLADGALEKLKFYSGIPSQMNITRGQNTIDIQVRSTLYILHV